MNQSKKDESQQRAPNAPAMDDVLRKMLATTPKPKPKIYPEGAKPKK